MRIRLTAMLSGRPSTAPERASPVMAYFVTARGKEFGRGTIVGAAPMSMIRPPLGSCAAVMQKVM